MVFLKKHLALFLSLAVFVGFGLFHITKFETTDEHFWKYDRIGMYYAGIQEGFRTGDFSKTRINDKPGVSVAIVTTPHKFFGIDPTTFQDREAEAGSNVSFLLDSGESESFDLFDIYQADERLSINLGLRLPLLLFNALVMLPLLYVLLRRIFRERIIVDTSIILIGMSPVHIGISQIVNPDALLWSFGAATILAYVAHLRAPSWQMALLTGVLLGFGLLSKYTASLLYLFLPLLFLIYSSFPTGPAQQYIPKLTRRDALAYGKFFLLIVVISMITFAVFMPDVFGSLKHFLYGTIYSPALRPLIDAFMQGFGLRDVLYETSSKYRAVPMAIFAGVFMLFFTVGLPLLVLRVCQVRKVFSLGLRFCAGLFVVLVIFSLVNAWTGASIIPLEDIKENSREAGELTFSAFAGDPSAVFWFKAILTQAQNQIFSVHPVQLFLLTFISLGFFVYRSHWLEKREHFTLVAFSLIIPFVFWVGALFGDVFVNIRYGLMLYVPFAITSAIALWRIMQFERVCELTSQILTPLTKRLRLSQYMLGILALSFVQVFSLFLIAPHYFNYHSFLLPREYVLTDAWGYGAYEAAEYLNTLDEAEDLIVWSDRREACQFFVGKCIISRNIPFDSTTVDYLIMSRRGSIVRQFRPRGSEENIPPSFKQSNYYDNKEFADKQTVWRLDIGGRSENFVKVLKVEK